jgi:hypothetical protein
MSGGTWTPPPNLSVQGNKVVSAPVSAPASTQTPAATTPTTTQPIPTTPAPASTSPVAGTSPTPATNPTQTPTQTPAQTQPVSPEQTQANTQALTQLIQQYNLSPDQQKALQSIYNAVALNDQTKVDQLVSGMTAAKEFSDPYFKAQITLATDALQRGLQNKDTDLAFKQQQLQSTLKNLQQDVASGKDYLSFQQKQDLNNLQRQYEDQLSSTRDNLAATGFTQSSRRSRQEQILNDVNSGLVQSTNRAYGEKQNSLTNQLTRGQEDTAAQIQYLKDVTAQGKLDLLRQKEGELGSQTIGALGYQSLGSQTGTNIAGSIEEKRAQDQLSFANSFVF